MSNAENLNPAESKMLRTLQAHENLHPGVPYAPGGPGWSTIMDLEKRGLVMSSEPKHPDERYGYILSGAGIVAVDALTAIQHPSEAGEPLPCPFCGRSDCLLIEHMEGTVLHPAYRVRCDNCGASSRYTDSGHVEAWNTRAVPPTPEAEGFWTWLDLAYRDGSKGEEPKFTKYNMEVAHRAGVESAQRSQGAQAGDAQKEISELIGFDFNPGELQTVTAEELLRVFWRGAALATKPAAFDGKTVADRLDQMADAQSSGSSAQSDLYAAATVWRKHLAPPVERREPEEFCEGQWWLEELDTMAKTGTPNQKRAVAVVRNMMGQLANARAEAALKPYLAAVDEGIRKIKEDE